jgi:hypothetical protein
MKRILILVTILATITSVQAVSFTWAFETGTADGYTPDGEDIVNNPTVVGWISELVEYDGGYAGPSGGNILGSSFLLFNESWNVEVTYGTVDLSEGTKVYMRIYNALTTDKSAATYYVNMGPNSGGEYSTVPSATSTVYFEGFSGNDGTASSHGTWIAIPEPCTFILFGLGGLVIAARRKFKK